MTKAGVIKGKIFTRYESYKAKIPMFVAMTPQGLTETIFDPNGWRTHLDYQLTELTISSNSMSAFWIPLGFPPVREAFY